MSEQTDPLLSVAYELRDGVNRSFRSSTRSTIHLARFVASAGTSSDLPSGWP